MPGHQGRAGAPRNPSAGELRCPWCQGELLREPRRIVDRLHSLIHPVKRYRCNNFSCQWIGNLPSRRGEHANDDPSDGPGDGHAAGKQSRGGVPASFVVHMVLVAIGVMFVVLFSSMEQASWVVENARAFDSIFISASEPALRRLDAR